MLHLDYRDARPIYEQVQDGLRRLLVSGAMASQLAINPNTIQRAYEALEQEGYLRSVPGKGSFAVPGSGVDSQRRDRLLTQFDTLTSELVFLGVPRKDLAARVSQGGTDHD